jgi:hypothetical protein
MDMVIDKTTGNKVLRLENDTDPVEYCEICGNILTYFMHNCEGTVLYEEFFGCKYCDDGCDMCR